MLKISSSSILVVYYWVELITILKVLNSMSQLVYLKEEATWRQTYLASQIACPHTCYSFCQNFHPTCKNKLAGSVKELSITIISHLFSILQPFVYLKRLLPQFLVPHWALLMSFLNKAKLIWSPRLSSHQLLTKPSSFENNFSKLAFALNFEEIPYDEETMLHSWATGGSNQTWFFHFVFLQKHFFLMDTKSTSL